MVKKEYMGDEENCNVTNGREGVRRKYGIVKKQRWRRKDEWAIKK